MVKYAMLSELQIKNFALIENTRVNFENGLNVLTGETGAGKSILLDALRLALGERLDSSMLREKAGAGMVQAVFLLDKEQLKSAQLSELLKDGDEYLFLKREFTSDGKSKATINGELKNLSELKAVGRLLMEIHGQSDQWTLFEENRQREFVNRLAGLYDSRKSLLLDYQKYFERFSTLKREQNELAQSRMNEERELDFLNHQIKEIESVSPVEGEDFALQEEKIRLVYGEKISELAGQALERLDESDSSASSHVGAAFKFLADWEKIDPGAESFRRELEEIQSLLEELIRKISDSKDELSFDSDRLSELDERLHDLDKVKRKYGKTISDVLISLEEARKKRDALANADATEKDIQMSLNECTKEMDRLSSEISTFRKKAAKELSVTVQNELKDLAVRHARFECKVEKIEYSPDGRDRIEFLISPNEGEPLMPLSKIASGGEAARMMLALKKVLAEHDQIPTLVFDEVDASIGGRLGAVIGEKMIEMAKGKQILAVTHLPQIASYANHHLKVIKLSEKGQTKIEYQSLNEEERIQELAHMMDGDRASKISETHARQMLRQAQKVAY